MVTPDGKQGVAVVFVLDSAHDQPGGDGVFAACEGGVSGLGDLGIGDQFTGVGVLDRLRVMHWCPGVVCDGGDRRLDRGIGRHGHRKPCHVRRTVLITAPA